MWKIWKIQPSLYANCKKFGFLDKFKPENTWNIAPKFSGIFGSNLGD
jgi:hypothetical protein